MVALSVHAAPTLRRLLCILLQMVCCRSVSFMYLLIRVPDVCSHCVIAYVPAPCFCWHTQRAYPEETAGALGVVVRIADHGAGAIHLRALTTGFELHLLIGGSSSSSSSGRGGSRRVARSSSQDSVMRGFQDGRMQKSGPVLMRGRRSSETEVPAGSKWMFDIPIGGSTDASPAAAGINDSQLEQTGKTAANTAAAAGTLIDEERPPPHSSSSAAQEAKDRDKRPIHHAAAAGGPTASSEHTVLPVSTIPTGPSAGGDTNTASTTGADAGSQPQQAQEAERLEAEHSASSAPAATTTPPAPHSSSSAPTAVQPAAGPRNAFACPHCARSYTSPQVRLPLISRPYHWVCIDGHRHAALSCSTACSCTS